MKEEIPSTEVVWPRGHVITYHVAVLGLDNHVDHVGRGHRWQMKETV